MTFTASLVPKDLDIRCRGAFVADVAELITKAAAAVARVVMSTERLEPVSAERQDGLWRIAIQDNGIGIAPEYHKQIFGVFKRLHGKAVPGTGIGLAICKRVVDRYGGQIWVESQVDQGATFYFTVPATAKGAAAHEQ